MAAETANRMQLRAALRDLRQLLADPEDTPRVFKIIRALGGPALQRGLQRFRTTAVGRQVLANEVDLLDTLRERDVLASLPVGSLGCVYAAFVASESISADGLAAASNDDGVEAYTFDDPDLTRYGERMRDQHDLWHVVTQYGRDTLGEACLLAFTYAQTGNRGVGVIALVGAAKLRRELGRGVLKAMWRAYRAGRHASWLPEQDWEALLHLPVEDVRRQLAVRPPTAYREVLARAA